ncbi:3-hydroxyacyl-CoA dehydrogenase family protein, partial [Oceanospirillum sp. HFRX-1_2]
VLLLDRASEGANPVERSQIAADALARMVNAGSRGALMSTEVAERISVGNTEDHLAQLADQDWIVEAIVERLDIKQALYRKIDQVRAPHCMVSSNTSTLPLRHLLEGMREGFRQHFVVTHFFNPPRYMRLVEFVSTDETSPEGLAALKSFNDKAMGKTVITCADRPGFIANRLGVYWMQVALQEAMALELDVRQADQIM